MALHFMNGCLCQSSLLGTMEYFVGTNSVIRHHLFLLDDENYISCDSIYFLYSSVFFPSVKFKCNKLYKF